MSALAAILRAAVRPVTARRTWTSLGYLLLAPFIGFASFLLLTVGLPLGVSLVVVWVGVPLLLGLLAAARAIGAFDRRLVGLLLGAEIDPPAALRNAEGSLWRRVVDLGKASSTWRAVLWMALRFPLGLVAAVLLGVVAVLAATLVAAPFDGVVAGSPLAAAAGLLGGIAACLGFLHLADGLGVLHAMVARGLLGPSRRERIHALEQRSAQAEARTGLARDLHDSVGHAVTAAVVQASAARRVIETDPAYAARALEAIEAQGREALEELDRVLGVLRSDDGSAPAPASLAGLDALVARTRAAGVPLTAEQRGDLSAVDVGVSGEAFRICQEGLTNVLRHAHGACTGLTVDVTGPSIVIDVVNGPGTSIGTRSGGRGLAGIAERIGPLGGTLRSGPTADGGYALHAELPQEHHGA
jgi:signal transduction histidine kinase